MGAGQKGHVWEVRASAEPLGLSFLGHVRFLRVELCAFLKRYVEVLTPRPLERDLI